MSSVIAKGIDVSYANGAVNWKTVKNGGQVDFAIIRTGYGKLNCAKQTDKQYLNNYNGAKAVGIPVGAYHYSYALTIAEAIQEADFCIDLLKGKQFEYPIFFDIEESSQAALNKSLLSDIVIAFCDKVEKAGYWVAVYSYASMLNAMDYNKIGRFDCWVAHTGVTQPSYTRPYGVWQYSHTGNMPGANISSGKCDMNYAYKDYPTLIKKAGLNGYSNKSTFNLILTDIAGQAEAENLATQIAATFKYKNHRVEEVKK